MEEKEVRLMKPKKLIRKYITEKLKEGEWETISDQKELNFLYALKVREELIEIQKSGHKDIMEFVDLIQVAFSFAKQNGFSIEQITTALVEKSGNKGTFGRLALNNLNPNNPSNKLYFEYQNNISADFDTKDTLYKVCADGEQSRCQCRSDQDCKQLGEKKQVRFINLELNTTEKRNVFNVSSCLSIEEVASRYGQKLKCKWLSPDGNDWLDEEMTVNARFLKEMEQGSIKDCC